MVACAFLALANPALADALRLESAGIRGGVGWGGDDNDLRLYEAFGKVALSWRRDLNERWAVRSGLEFSAGTLRAASDSVGIFQCGPGLVFSRTGFPVEFEFGSNPTLLTHARFGDKNVGSRFHFSSYAGVRARLNAHATFGYRVQHTSNVGLGSPNPGVNLHLLTITYEF